MNEEVRRSRAIDPQIITDPQLLAEREAANTLEQFATVSRMVETFLDEERQPFRFRPSHLLHLHRVALAGISAYAGNFRPSEIEIGGSLHEPPGAHEVPSRIEELCDYVNQNWNSMSATHLSAYVM